ncbi:asparagine synthase-related protein [Cohnella hashimotonis]|uniref:asparagine synthase (glutamine-hydrolyzing) n=1 Tax=Cohnella hashimotonis TaxID=2826895 RepID=A0ABT6TSY0_9BACL|nr:asparagine synthase-related protein [Cohnella hashimotonis]MDI4649044.1 asparagine synthase-related protein [Cohnella hashimotonis]
MSAIAGLLNEHEPVSIEAAGLMMKALEKYPAHHVRTWHDRHVFMGCHAQWFAPESAYDRQPCREEGQELVIAADAILDNREELFGRLQVERARRERMTDSDLILAAYRKWGEEAPGYLIGDFAFVLWDERRRRLFGARDLAGSRTLYYVHRPGRFAFCTVMNPLLALPGVGRELDESWLAEFLAIPIILDTIDVRSTVYRQIGQIPPAHAFTVEQGSLKVRRYGSLTADVPKLKLRSSGEYEEAFREVFREAVVSRLRTSRNVGASLSGGLDSGAVVSFAAAPLREQGKTLHTYSYVPRSDFADWTPRSMAADETPFIRDIVDHVGTLSHSYMDFAKHNSFEEIDDLLALMEAPYKFFENSYWFKGILAQASKQDVGVLLHGGNGNYSISWGPAMDYYALLLRRLRWVRLYRELSQYGKNVRVGRSRLLPYIGRLAFANPAPKPLAGIPMLIHPDLAARTGVFDRLKGHDVGLTDAWMNEFDARTYQFDNLSILNHQGTSSTKLSLRYAVRERDPTCDPRVVRFCLSVPVEQYVQGGMDRALVRRATAGYLPDSVRLNQRVRGVQGADWIHRVLPAWDEMSEELRRLCDDSRASGLLNVEQVRLSLAEMGNPPRPDRAFDRHARLLMQSLIVYRFLRQGA